MKYTKTLFMIIISLALLPICYSEDFVAGANTAVINSCVGEQGKETILIKNIDDSTNEFRVSVSGSKYVILSPKEFTLGPGKTKDILLYYQATEKGNYDLTIKIESSKGTVKELNLKLNSQICNNNLLIAKNFNQSACPCTEMVYDFTLENSGSYKEEYSFGLNKFAEYATVSYNKIVLEPGAKKDIKLSLNLDCSIYGENILNLYSTAKNSGIKVKVPLIVNVNRCYDYEIETGKIVTSDRTSFSKQEPSYDICAGDNKSIQLMLSNDQHFNDSLSISLEGPEWVRIRNDSLKLASFGESMTLIDLQPEVEGEYKIIINVVSSIGDERKQYEIDVKVGNCYGLGIEIPKSVKICNCIGTDVDFTVYNNGRFEENVDLSFDGPDFLKIDASNTTIKARSSKEFVLEASPNCAIKGSSSARISAGLGNNIEVYEDIDFDIVPIEDCYDLKFDVQNMHIKYEENLIPVGIKHTGVEKAHYLVDAEGPDWVKADIKEFTLEPGESYSFNLIAAPGNISSGRYDVTLKINVENVVYQKEIRLNLSDKEPFFSMLWGLIVFYRYWIYAILIVLIFVILFIIFIRSKLRVWKIRKLIKSATSNKKKKKHGWIFILVLVIIAILLAAYFFKYVWLFVVTYVWYILIGFLILTLIIVFLSKKEK